MNYKNIYNQLIAKAQLRNTGQDNHHIIPKSLGGSNEADNLVLLTHKEHYVAHHLLMKFNRCKETCYAFRLMTQMRTQRITARVFENLKRDFAKQVSKTHKGKILSEETKAKIRAKRKLQTFSDETKALWSRQRKGTQMGKDNHMFGKTHKPESIAKMIENRSGEKHFAVKGYYITPWGKFLTAGEAADANAELHINHTSLRKWCKQDHKTVRKQSYEASQYLNSLNEDTIGKTFKDIGFGYEEIAK
jgi:hypothetical protein